MDTPASSSPPTAVRLAVALLLLSGPLYFVQGGGWNQNTRLALTRAIVEHGQLAIDPYLGEPVGVEGTGDFAEGVTGYHYTDKSPGPSWLAAPVYAVVRAVWPAGHGPYATRVDALAHATVVALIGGATVAAGLALLGLLWTLSIPRWWALALVVGWGLGTMALPYATLLFNHQLAASLSLLAFCLVARADETTPPWRILLAGHLLGWASICDYACLATCLACGLLLMWRTRARAALGVGGLVPGALLVAGFAPPVLAFMAYNAHCFGGPLTLGYQKEAHEVWDDLSGGNVGFSAPRLDKLREVTIGRYRGLLWGSPFLALAPLGLLAGLLRRELRALTLACGLVIAGFLTYNASFVYWHAGYAAGPRFLVPGLPFMVLSLAALPALLRALAVPLLIASVALMTATTAVDPQVPGGHHDDRRGQLAHKGEPPDHYADPWFDFTLPRLRAGQLGDNRQSHVAPLAVPEHPRLPPALEALAQRCSWNLGERLGLPGLAQLLPLLALWAACLAVAGRALARDGATQDR